MLSRRVSVADLLETALWLAIPYLVIGLVWAFFHSEEVGHLQDLLQAALPVGAEMTAYLLVAGLWPVYVFVPALCLA